MMIDVIGGTSESDEATIQLARCARWCVQEGRLSEDQAAEALWTATETLVSAGIVYEGLGQLWKEAEDANGIWAAVYCLTEHDTTMFAMFKAGYEGGHTAEDVQNRGLRVLEGYEKRERQQVAKMEMEADIDKMPTDYLFNWYLRARSIDADRKLTNPVDRAREELGFSESA